MYIRLVLCVLAATLVSSNVAGDQWVLEAKNPISERTVTFKNTTKAGKVQLLSWTWSTSNTESWENTIRDSISDDSMEGSLVYRNTKNGDKTHVHIQWKLMGDYFTSSKSNKMIPNNTWSITTWNGLNTEFSSNKLGIWKLILMDKYIITNNPEVQEEYYTIARKKRSESESELDENEERNITTQQAGVMECIFDFLFGDGDPVSGRSEGVFTRVKNWFKGLACRIGGSCEEEPSGGPVLPEVPMPPFNPDAEPITEVPSSSGDNDVFKK